MFIDPPYLMVCDDLYLSPTVYSYKKLIDEDLEKLKSNIYIVLEDNFIINKLYQEYYLYEYNKKYTGFKKKESKHVIFYNHSTDFDIDVLTQKKI